MKINDSIKTKLNPPTRFTSLQNKSPSQEKTVFLEQTLHKQSELISSPRQTY